LCRMQEMEDEDMEKITVIGGGNGGQGLAGHLASKGFRVALFEHPEFGEKIAHLKETRTITLTGAVSARGVLASVTTDPAEALEEAEILYFVAPTFAQKSMFEILSPHFQKKHHLFLMPGNFGSLVLRGMLEENKVQEMPMIAEGDTMPYACRIERPGVVNVWGIKSFMSAAALPASATAAFIQKVEKAFPILLKQAPGVLAIGLYNTNMILHCPTMIMNAGRIESEKGDFRFYADGMTESVCRVMESMDAERIAIGKALGVDLVSTMDDLKELYNLEGDTLRESILNNAAYCGHGADAPSSAEHRYLTEDVPFLLVPVAEIGKALGVPTPTMDCIIHLAGVVNEEDYRKTGRSLKEIGCSGSVEEISALCGGTI